MDVQRRDISRTVERLKIEVKLLLSANRKSYMPRRLAQQQMTLSDLEWYRALSLRSELLVSSCCCCCCCHSDNVVVVDLRTANERQTSTYRLSALLGE